MLTDRDAQIGSLAGMICLQGNLAPLVSEADVEQAEFIIPARYEIHSVQVYCTAIAGTCTVDVKINGVTALAAPITPTANTATQPTLSATRSARRGTAAQRITVHCTTNGTGQLTRGRFTLCVRGYPGATE
jgi:hypothetical protein